MLRLLFVAATLVATQVAAGAAVAPPYLKLAQVLGTPTLADSYGTADKSQLLLKFVARGESLQRWTKLTTVTILKVPDQDTSAATRGVVARIHTLLAKRPIKLARFEKSAGAPLTAYYEFEVDGERDGGVIYSPHAGFVSVAQLSAKRGAAISSDDVRALKSVIGRR